MKLWSCLIFAISIVIAVAEVPSYIQVCGRNDPHLDTCILNSVNALRNQLRDGIPELEVPSIEPLLLKKGLPLADSKDLRAYAKNVRLYNIHMFEVKHLHMDLENNRIELNAYFDTVRLTGEYEVNAKVLVPITGKGAVEILAKNIDIKSTLHYKHVNTKKGSRLFFTEMACKLSIKDYVPKFRLTEGSGNTLNEVIDSILNNGKTEILQTIIPQLETAIASRILEFSNKISSHFTYDELFPDRV